MVGTALLRVCLPFTTSMSRFMRPYSMTLAVWACAGVAASGDDGGEELESHGTSQLAHDIGVEVA